MVAIPGDKEAGGGGSAFACRVSFGGENNIRNRMKASYSDGSLRTLALRSGGVAAAWTYLSTHDVDFQSTLRRCLFTVNILNSHDAMSRTESQQTTLISRNKLSHFL